MTFKVRLLLGAAAPFVLAMPAFAQVSISTATTTPVQTSTANSGVASDVNITSTGSVTLTGAPANSAAVTIDSNNSVTNAGTIATIDSSNSIGVRIAPNTTGNFTNGGVINLSETYTRTDTDNDKDLDGPLVQGTNRIGVLVESGGAMTGNVTVNGTVTVNGNDSRGVAIRSDLNGAYTQAGSITVVGANGAALDVQENVTGNVRLSGSMLGRGENSVGARFLGDVAGEFLVNGSIGATGFTDERFTNTDPNLASVIDADDLLVGGSALEIRGDLGRGLLVNGAAVGGVDPTPDVKDVIQDYNEDRATGSITSFGSAPALVIQSLDGAAGDAVVLSRVRESVLDTTDDDGDSNFSEVIATFDYDYGFVNRGTITGNGLNKGFAATGVKIAGSADGTHTTTIDGGVFNGGTIIAQAPEANATAFLLGSGASTPLLVNTGTISSAVVTTSTHDSTGVLVEAGASLPTVNNSGRISAQVQGYDGDAVAFRDLSGTVTNFTNSSRVTAGYVDNDTTDNITSGGGQAIALDLSHSASGVTLTQNDTVDNARIIGDVLLGAGNDQFNILSGIVIGDVSFGGGSDTLNITTADLTGDTTFGGSGATVALNATRMTGALSLGGASGSLSFANQSTYNGAITNTGAGAVSLTANNSTVNNSGSGTLNLTSMSLSNGANLGLVVNNARISGNQPIFNVTGTADIAANTVLTPIFDQFTDQPFTLRVLNAGTLNLGGTLSSMLNANSPYIYDVSLVQPNPNAIDLVLDVKTSSELGLNTRQASAYGAVLDLLGEDDNVGSVLTSLTGANEFVRGWADLLPGSDAAVMKVLASNATAAFGATAHRLDLVSNKPNAPGGAWVEEFGVFQKNDATSDSVGVEGGGLGVAAGIDVLSTGTTLIGAYVALESAELEEEHRSSAPLNVSQTAFGLYGGWMAGNFAINGAASYGAIKFTSDRKIEVGTLSDRMRAEWDGQSYTAGARATYTVPMGWLSLKPFVAADYIGFNQDAYQENATTNQNLAIVADDSDASLATASYGVALTGDFGGDDAFKMKPELSVGYRNVLNWENTPATMHFAGNSSGTSFQLAPGLEPEDAIVAGLGLNVDSQFLNLKVGYDAEIGDTSITHYGSITLRLAFW